MPRHDSARAFGPALEALGAVVVLDLAEPDSLGRLAARIELAAMVAGQDATHEVVVLGPGVAAQSAAADIGSTHQPARPIRVIGRVGPDI